ncbi:hypothetical protein QQ045_020358 [Rhodiola kirilowii]
MNDLLRPWLRKCVLVFMDDILVYSRSWTDHCSDLSMILELLQQHKCLVKASKCEIAQNKVHYLGHVITVDGMEVDPTKVIAVTGWPLPTNLKQLGGFLSLTGYYRRFVPRYAQVAAPLIDMTCYARMPLYVHLLPLKHSITLNNCSLPHLHLDYLTSLSHSCLTLMLLDVVWVLSSLNKGDRLHHQPLRVILTQTIHTPDQQWWISKLMGYDFDVHYKPGRDNTPTDTISRPPPAVYDTSKALFCKVHDSPELCEHLQIRDGLVLYKGKILVPKDAAIRNLILHEFHDSPIDGHAGIARTLARISTTFHWEGLRKDVTTYVNHCVTCQQSSLVAQPPQQSVTRPTAHDKPSEQASHTGRLCSGGMGVCQAPNVSSNLIASSQSKKLAKRYYGPFEIIAKVGPVAYKLALPEDSKVHNVFHASVLKKCHTSPPFQQTEWPKCFTDHHPVLLHAKILDRRVVRKGDLAITQVLVQWESYDTADATWEDASQLQQEYPELHLEDEVLRGDGSNDAMHDSHARTKGAVEVIRKGCRTNVLNKRLHAGDYILSNGMTKAAGNVPATDTV